MTRITINITGESNALVQLVEKLKTCATSGVFPSLHAALEESAEHVARTWKSFAGGGSPPPGLQKLKKPSGAYMRSITWSQVNPFTFHVFSDAPQAHWLEYGTEPFDMKKTHTTGPRSRVAPTIVSKKTGKVLRKGGPYLIVPFRWGTPKTTGFQNVMPQSLYAIVKKFTMSKTTDKQYNAPNAQGQDVMRWTQQWGSRLSASHAQQTSTPHATGMVRSAGYRNQDGTLQEQSAGYFTFRIISANSKNKNAWFNKGIPGQPITKAIARHCEKTIHDLITKAIQEDFS
jgi:hypothetical protein